LPPQLTWLHRLPDIVAQIKDVPSPVIDRSVVEQVFQVQRRQAHKLMAEFGAHQLGSGRGRTLVLTRDELVARLEALFNTEEFQRTRLRKQKLATSLLESRERLKHRRVEIRVDPRQRSLGREAWPATLQLSPGRLQIDFTSPNHLAEQLALVALALEDEWETFSASGIAPEQPPALLQQLQGSNCVADMFRDLELLEEKSREKLDQNVSSGRSQNANKNRYIASPTSVESLSFSFR
jgi:hypothetical protein